MNPLSTLVRGTTQSGRPLQAAAFFVCLAVGAIEATQGYLVSHLRDDPHPVRQAALFSGLPWLVAALLAPLVVLAAVRWPLDRNRWRADVPRLLLAMVVFIAAHELMVAWLLFGLGVFPAGWRLLLVKQASARSALDAVLYWALVGGVHAVQATGEAHERAQAETRLTAMLTEARLVALRAQLDPHFLFNSLNSVSALALRGEREGVVRALATLSDLLRTTLGGAPTQEVALAAERRLVEQYLELQLLRFSDRLRVSFDVDPTLADAVVPAMVLQPIIENSIKHGVAVRPGPMEIEITARREDAHLHLEVRDSGPGLRPDAGEGIGLANTRARLSELYGDDQCVTIASGKEVGTVVTVTLPYRQMRTASIGAQP
jgi:signal transduction histidine kinase